MNLANVNIDDANISGLTILGCNIEELIKDAQQKKNSGYDASALALDPRPALRRDCRAASLSIARIRASVKRI